MSLATTLAKDGMRPASFLPSIKCSSCGEEIEIAAMGDHTCSKAPPSPKPEPASLTNPFTLRQMNASGQSTPHTPSPLQQNQPVDVPKHHVASPSQQSQSADVSRAQAASPPKQKQSVDIPTTRVRAPSLNSNHMAAPKPIRAALPKINPDAANKPFLAPRPPRSDSPLSPAISVRSGSSNGQRPGYKRSVTSPMPSPMPRLWDPRPPSPELSANLDCAFPPFPGPSSAKAGSRPGTPSGSRTPGPGERAASRSESRQDGRMGPRSPSVGPPSAGDRRKPSVHQLPKQRRPSMASLKSSHDPPPLPTEPIPRPSTAHAHRSQIPRSTTPGANATSPEKQKKPPPARPERPTEDVLSPRFLNKMSAEPAATTDVDVPVMDLPSTFSPSDPPVPPRSTERSQTLPIPQASSDEPSPAQALHRTSTEPDMRGRERRPTLTTSASNPEPFSASQPQGRARSQSRSAPRFDHRLQDAPPVPKPVQQCKQERTHSPSHSGSSTASSHRSVGNVSSNVGPSPISSAASSVDAFSPVNYEGSQYGDDEKMRVAGLNFKTPAQKPGMRAEQPAQRSPPRSINRPSPPKELAQPVSGVPAMPFLSSPPLESPMDPVFQNNKPAPSHAFNEQSYFPSHGSAPSFHRPFSPSSPGPKQGFQPMPLQPGPPQPPGDYDTYRAPSPQSEAGTRSKSNASQHRPFSPGTSVRSLSPQPEFPLPPVPQDVPRMQTPSGRRPSARPSCRGCGKIIEGKSVKAADGRLTGRWHKACFTCRTCEQPFTTADFYVHANHPYCEQHYHEKNGSLCHGCHRGIEGQYLETTSSSSTGSDEKKYHPRCFTCHDCRMVLADDYFEINAKVYCERHALAAMRGQARVAGPGLNAPDRRALTAERRTTKLMMM